MALDSLHILMLVLIYEHVGAQNTDQVGEANAEHSVLHFQVLMFGN